MDDATKLRKMRTLTGSKEDDTVLLFLLALAKRKMLNRLYPFAKTLENVELPERYEDLQIEIATVLLNKRGIEGEVQHNENGVSRTYGTSDVPAALLAELTPMCAIPE